MKRLLIGLSLAGVFLGARLTFGQSERGNPFIDRSDNGETVHVLPPEAAIHSPDVPAALSGSRRLRRREVTLSGR